MKLAVYIGCRVRTKRSVLNETVSQNGNGVNVKICTREWTVDEYDIG